VFEKFWEWLASKSHPRFRYFRGAKQKYAEFIQQLTDVPLEGLTPEQRAMARTNAALREAEDLFEKALELSEKEEATNDAASCYFQLGMIYHHQDRLDDAARAFHQALERLWDLPRPDAVAKRVLSGCQYRLGLLHLEQGRLTDARRDLEASLTIDTALQDLEGQRLCRLALALLEKAERS
jgi:tetratricopeptide (TPR) repeat protein